MGDASFPGNAPGTVYRYVIALGLAALAVALGGQQLSVQPAAHPLDPLTAEEYWVNRNKRT